MKALVWDDGMGEEFETVDIPEELKADAEQWRHELIDVVSQHDENVLEKYVGEEEITAEDIRKGLRHATIQAGSRADPLRHRVQETRASSPCSTAVVDYLPSPLEGAAGRGTDVKGEQELVRQADDSEPSRRWPFKIMSDPTSASSPYFRGVLRHNPDRGRGPQRDP
jgi:elongation factor G